MSIKTSLLVAVMVVSTGCVQWSGRDTAASVIALSAAAVDMYQTDVYAVPRCEELNPLIGRCGQGISANIVLPVSQLVMLGVAAVLPPKYRPYFLGAWIGTEALTIENNYLNIHSH